MLRPVNLAKGNTTTQEPPIEQETIKKSVKAVDTLLVGDMGDNWEIHDDNTIKLKINIWKGEIQVEWCTCTYDNWTITFRSNNPALPITKNFLLEFRDGDSMDLDFSNLCAETIEVALFSRKIKEISLVDWMTPSVPVNWVNLSSYGNVKLFRFYKTWELYSITPQDGQKLNYPFNRKDFKNDVGDVLDKEIDNETIYFYKDWTIQSIISNYIYYYF